MVTLVVHAYYPFFPYYIHIIPLIFFLGRLHVNRAVDGDVVAIQVIGGYLEGEGEGE